MNEKRCLFIAGEASGDTLAAELARALKATGRGWEFIGAGGPRLAEAGASLTVDLTRHAVVGLWEVLKHYPELRRVFRQLLDLAVARQPEYVVLVDYPGFNLRFAKALRQYVRARRGLFFNWNPKIVYYVSPQLWAWHSSRVHQIARDVDLLLSIFPFEKAWYAEREPGLRVEFVGHPLIDRYRQTTAADARLIGKNLQEKSADELGGVGELSGSEETRTVSAIPPPLLLLLPGSRARELKKHLPRIVAAVRLINASAKVRWRMVLPNEKLVELARIWTRDLPQIQIQTAGLAEALAQATLAIASSGTVTMECAYFGVPTVVIYRTSWGTYQLGRRLVKVRHFAMPNLLAGHPLYPELLQYEVSGPRIAREALDLLEDPERRRKIKDDLRIVIDSLGSSGASQRAARALCAL